MHTCRVILLTSLVWFLVDVVLLTFYSDCIGSGWNCRRRDEYIVEVSHLWALRFIMLPIIYYSCINSE